MENIDSHEHEVATAVNNLTRTLRRASTYRQSFLRGIFGGLGTAVGATLVAAFVLAGFAAVLSRFGIKDVVVLPNANVQLPASDASE